MMQRSALISEDERFRYSLLRVWRPKSIDEDRRICWVMLNPSVADANIDDSTVKRCIAYSINWGYDSLEVVNLYALRATDQKELGFFNVVGERNDEEIVAAVSRAERVIAAWGVPKLKKTEARIKDVEELIWPHAMDCLKLTKDGHPQHPLYVRGDAQPIVYREANWELENAS